MNPFVQQLAGLCRSNPAGTKWVFLPSHGVGHVLGERIALSGVAWANMRFTPPLDVALRMAAPFLVERGIEPLADELGGGPGDAADGGAAGGDTGVFQVTGRAAEDGGCAVGRHP